jgi:hypothetical protein
MAKSKRRPVKQTQARIDEAGTGLPEEKKIA